MNFVKDFFCIYWNECEIFVFKSMVYYIYWLVYAEPSLYFRDKANFIIVENLFDVCVSSVCYYFIEHFESMFIRDIGMQFSFLLLSTWVGY